MRDLFMLLMTGLNNFGKLKEASMYRSGVFSIIEVETPDGIFRVTITKEEEVKEDA